MHRSAGLLLVHPDGLFLLARRSPNVTDPGVWSIPGGHVTDGETDTEGAIREFIEEMGSLPALRFVTARRVRTPDDGIFTTVIATVGTAFWEPRLNWENDAWGWFRLNELPMPLHPGARRLLLSLDRSS